MTMVVSRKQRIFFRYEGERGAFLVLHHGLLGSHADWYAAGYVEALAREFRVVVPDARGHGRSDKPAGKEHYSAQQMAEDIVEILNELGIRNSHFVGYGLGALVGLELLRRFPERMRIAILGGESPLMTAGVQAVYRAEAESLRPISLGEYLQALRDQGRVVRGAGEADEEQERPAALALLEALSEWEPAPPERIQVMSPLTLFAGSEDPAAARVEAARSGVSRARYVPFAGMGHARLFYERTQLMEEILRLLKSGRRDDGGEARPRGEGHGAAGQSHSAGGQGGEGRHGDPARREGDRPGAGESPPGAAERPAGPPAPDSAPAEAPSPIPGAVPDLRGTADASEPARDDERNRFDRETRAAPGPASGREADEAEADDAPGATAEPPPEPHPPDDPPKA
jgi:pimeloyl-ACP methyl ester carboxylesterase